MVNCWRGISTNQTVSRVVREALLAAHRAVSTQGAQAAGETGKELARRLQAAERQLANALGALASATLADGSETTFPYYGVAVLWDGRIRYVEADAADMTPLTGRRPASGGRSGGSGAGAAGRQAGLQLLAENPGHPSLRGSRERVTVSATR